MIDDRNRNTLLYPHSEGHGGAPMLTLRKMVAGRGHCGTIIRVGWGARGKPIVILVITGLPVGWERE